MNNFGYYIRFRYKSINVFQSVDYENVGIGFIMFLSQKSNVDEMEKVVFRKRHPALEPRSQSGMRFTDLIYY